MRTIYGFTVGGNEAHRYLTDMLTHLGEVVDFVWYYDDQSTDGSLQIAEQLITVHSTRRPDSVPSFLEHEGRFRQDAWTTFENTLLPETGDWILVMDTDERLVSTGNNVCVRCELDQVIDAAERQGAETVLLPVPEVFGYDSDGWPLVRKDGFWGTIAGTRLFRYRPGGVFQDKPMGSGAEPTYVQGARRSSYAAGLHLMHFGYADARDQEAKYARYTSLEAHGHNNAHVNSIMIGPRQLERWPGGAVDLRRAA